MIRRSVLIAAACELLLAHIVIAQSPPPFKLLRYDENYEYLADPARRTEYLDSIKFIQLGSDSTEYVSFGGEIRQRFEYFRKPGWSQESQDRDGYLLQRYMLHADLHLGERLRFFGQIKSGIASGRAGGPRPADEDKADVNQAFLEFRSGGVTIRAGRQEIALGSSRLVAPREGPNVRQSFDGVRLIWRTGDWRVDALATRPVETNPGVFDDSPDHRRAFWGLYVVRPISDHGNVDLYYFGLDRKVARFDQGVGRELRHSGGARVWGNAGRMDYNYEVVYQAGRFAGGGIRAWTTASDTGYRFDAVKFRPRIGLRADIASGDRNTHDRSLGTFNALFPRGSYFSEADLLGPYNLMDLHPSISLKIAETITLTPDLDFFWRQSTRDGIYGVSGVLLHSGGGSRARYIGSHADVQLEWAPDRHWTAACAFLKFFPGAFLKETTPNRPLSFAALWVSFRF